jgi:hypothetical protein
MSKRGQYDQERTVRRSMPATLVSCVSIMTSSWKPDKLEAYPTVSGNPTSWKLIPL